MCGIAGQLNFAVDAPIDRDRLQRMTRTITHRGPDDEGYFVSGPVGLGFRRLSIIDLAGGHQPMADAGETVWVVFNGEIYNFKELRFQLEARGHSFRTNSDTEVIIHGYKEWGADVFNHLNGMFGVAIWDVSKRQLLVARDAMGIKPVYYAPTDRTLYFGSEIRPVLAGLGGSPSVDPLAVNLFLRYRYTPAPYTLFRGVRKLAPGEMLTATSDGVKVRRWYNFEPTPLDPMPSDGEATEQLLDLYKQAMKRHLISDVPLGLLLSGGVDSGLLLGLMNLSGQSWRTFTVGYGSAFKDDELTDAAGTASIYSARHTEIRLSQADFEAALPRIVGSLEEPVASSSIVPMYFVCQRARQDVKVALMGQGPDELFGGYTRHLGVRYGGWWRKLPGPVRSIFSSIIRRLPRQESLKRSLYSLGLKDRLRRYQNVFSLMPGERVDGLFHDGLLPPNPGDAVLDCWKDLIPVAERQDELNGFQLLELRSALPDELLMYADKLSMAHALEVRVPYLDRTIVEYVQRLPASFKVRNGERKWLHRRVCGQFLPASILERKKRGFAVNVVDDWFQKSVGGTLEAMFMDEDSRMFHFLKPMAVRQLYEEHRAGRHDHHKMLFSLVILEQLLRAQPAAT
ncbi:MAG TPA: asparagine synthase (glutamine-hydrolyzing) [Candidatus Aquilonibacter sp.]|nr:asparagine synthase (glutamine-hydrolyzing) [Candidatus Aquilonibacter sp.]